MNTQIVLIIGVVLVVGMVLLNQRAAKSKGNGGSADPLAEAEIYIAYGRKKEAMEVLEKAIRENPERKDIEAKLSELKRKV